MCLYPKLIKNKKYQPNKKNNYNAPILTDRRLEYVTAACGKCMECRKQKARAWQVRLAEEQNEKQNGIFVTLTFNEENYNKIKNELKTTDDNEIATKGVRLFLERVRKETKKSLRHWLTTEKGHNGTNRIHLHGIIWNNKGRELIEKHWKYGFVYLGQYVNEKTINYIIKYITKIDIENKGFESKILTSAGIGKNYINSINAKNNKYKEDKTNTTYRLKSGTIINLPIYYRNKIYTEEQREEIWKNKIDKGIVYVCGDKINIENTQEYNDAMMYHRQKAKEIYKYEEKTWDREKYIRRLKAQQKYKEKIIGATAKRIKE